MVADGIANVTGVRRRLDVDLAVMAGRLFDPDDPGVDDLLRVVARSQIAVIASPTYKASYTGLLKAFLDRYGDQGLGSCIAVPLMTGGSRDHALAVDLALRPLLVELGAVVPTTSLFISMPEYETREALVEQWIERNRDVLCRLA